MLRDVTTSSTNRRVLVFDVNETLLDLRPLDERFAQVFGDAAVRIEWFNILLERAFTAQITGAYRDFAALGKSAVKMVAAKHGKIVDSATIDALVETIKHVPAHPEVREAVALLHDAGFTLTALTQSAAATLNAQIANAGLKPYFTRLFSVDAIRRYKPDASTYSMVATEMGCELSNLRLIAAHAWDTDGAMRAGLRAAFVARPGHVLDPDLPAPDIIGADLMEVAVQILGVEGDIKA